MKQQGLCVALPLISELFDGHWLPGSPGQSPALTFSGWNTILPRPRRLSLRMMEFASLVQSMSCAWRTDLVRMVSMEGLWRNWQEPNEDQVEEQRSYCGVCSLDSRLSQRATSSYAKSLVSREPIAAVSVGSFPKFRLMHKSQISPQGKGNLQTSLSAMERAVGQKKSRSPGKGEERSMALGHWRNMASWPITPSRHIQPGAISPCLSLPLFAMPRNHPCAERS